MSTTNIFEATVNHFLAPILPFMNDPSVSEIMVNAPSEIYIEKEGRLVKTEAAFADAEALRAAVNNILQYTGKRATDEHPLIDSRLPDGSRVHVILGNLCRRGTVMTIRKFARIMFDAEHLLEVGSWTPEAMDYLRTCVLAEKNLLVAGGTSSGKTCLLNVLSGFIPDGQRIVTIEDSAELELQKEHLLSLESRPADRWGRGEVTIRDLFRSSLRLRPDRIVIGEVRGGEALDMIQDGAGRPEPPGNPGDDEQGRVTPPRPSQPGRLGHRRDRVDDALQRRRPRPDRNRRGSAPRRRGPLPCAEDVRVSFCGAGDAGYADAHGQNLVFRAGTEGTTSARTLGPGGGVVRCKEGRMRFTKLPGGAPSRQVLTSCIIDYSPEG
jgi:type IV secretory pathway ATPase VirB11/archaellum biosynthesis ATPase